jgi:MOSC domain-containing protein YiiM
MLPVPGRVLSVNLADIRVLQRKGKPVETGIWKLPTAGRVDVGRLGFAGDRQADLQAHGGPDKAVYAYPLESYALWEQELGRALPAGTFGENLTLQGVEVDDAVVGERWAVGTALLEVSSPRIPCWKLAAKMDDPAFVKRFARARRPGAYLRVVQAGTIGPGDDVRVVERPDHGVTVAMVSAAYLHDHSLAAAILAAPRLPDGWREWALERVTA